MGTAPGFHASVRVASPARVTDTVASEVRAGMTRGDIVALIGEAPRTMRFPLTRTTSWDYPFVDSWGYASEFSVVFNDAGVVVGKFSSRNDY